MNIRQTEEKIIADKTSLVSSPVYACIQTIEVIRDILTLRARICAQQGGGESAAIGLFMIRESRLPGAITVSYIDSYKPNPINGLFGDFNISHKRFVLTKQYHWIIDNNNDSYIENLNKGNYLLLTRETLGFKAARDNFIDMITSALTLRREMLITPPTQLASTDYIGYDDSKSNNNNNHDNHSSSRYTQF